MQAWLPVLLVWFVSLFTSTFTVISCIYRFLDRRKYRWRYNHKCISPWILLALLTAAFMVGNVCVIASSKETRVQRMSEHAGLLIGLFVGLFFIICILTAILWSRYHKRASKNRAGKAKDNELTIPTNTCVEQNCEPAVTSYENHDQSDDLDLDLGQEIERTAVHQLSASFQPTLSRNDEILILRNLSNPDEEFCLNLSNSNVPVFKRKSMASIEDIFQIHPIEDHRIALDVEC